MDNGISTISKGIEMGKRKLAVSVENAYKKYSNRKDSNQILKGFSMNVQKGHIYGLLGSSGCGKTTLLSCVVGVRRLDSGKILVFDAEPGTKESGIPGRKVGYMPQEIALYPEFSIKEILQYYGRIYGMPKWEVDENTEFLVDFLNLPTPTRRISNLSGGQQRRVSFAVALIHNPELLILDEPTVGVDPLLRQSIWTHLIKLATTTKTTIIITTHFIEEARDANCVGLMRNGRLLVEDSPMNLMARYNTYVLEEIVVAICLKEEESSDEKNTGENTPRKLSTDSRPSTPVLFVDRLSVRSSLDPEDGTLGPDIDSSPDLFGALPDREIAENKPDIRRASLGQVLHRASNPHVTFKPTLTLTITEKLERIYALILKQIYVLTRNILLVGFMIGLPAMQLVLICLAIGVDPYNIKVAVVNQELQESNNMCPVLSEKEYGCLMSSEKYNSFASCQYLQLLNPEIFILIPYDNEEKAIEDTKLTKIWGVIIFRKNFTAYFKDRLMFSVYAEKESLDNSQIVFHLDMSNKQIGLQLQKNFYSTLKDFMYDIAEGCKVPTDGLDLPLLFDSPIYGNDDTNFTDFIAPGMLLAILFFYPLCSTGILMISDKKSGAMERTKVAGVTTVDLLVSQFSIQLAILILQAILSFVIMISVFQIRVVGSVPLALTLGVLIGLSGITLGFLLSSVCKDELEMVMLSMGMFFPNFILSGVIWPLEGMPFYLKNAAYILPCTLAGESFRSIIGRGLGFFHHAVWPGFLTTIAYILFYCILTLALEKLKSRN